MAADKKGKKLPTGIRKKSENSYEVRVKHDGKTYYVNCHSRKDDDTYYIDGTELTKQFDDISKKIKAFKK